MFLHLSVILLTGGGGVHSCYGGHVWLLRGGVCGCSRKGGCRAWLLQGGHAWLLWGACMVARGGMCGCSGGWGRCAWLLRGDVRGCLGGVHGIRRDTQIRSMSGRYASYWNAFLFNVLFTKTSGKDLRKKLTFAMV